MSQVGDVLSLVNKVIDLVQTANDQRARADNLASRNIRLTKEIDEALGISKDDDENKRALQKEYGPGLEGRVKFLLSVAKSKDARLLPGIYPDNPRHWWVDVKNGFRCEKCGSFHGSYAGELPTSCSVPDTPAPRFRSRFSS